MWLASRFSSAFLEVKQAEEARNSENLWCFEVFWGPQVAGHKNHNQGVFVEHTFPHQLWTMYGLHKNRNICRKKTTQFCELVNKLVSRESWVMTLDLLKKLAAECVFFGVFTVVTKDQQHHRLWLKNTIDFDLRNHSKRSCWITVVNLHWQSYINGTYIYIVYPYMNMFSLFKDLFEPKKVKINTGRVMFGLPSWAWHCWYLGRRSLPT